MAIIWDTVAVVYGNYLSARITFNLVLCHGSIDLWLGTKDDVIRASLGVSPHVCYSAVEASRR